MQLPNSRQWTNRFRVLSDEIKMTSGTLCRGKAKKRREKSGGNDGREGKKGDAVKHSAGRVIRLQKSTSVLPRVTKLPPCSAGNLKNRPNVPINFPVLAGNKIIRAISVPWKKDAFFMNNWINSFVNESIYKYSRQWDVNVS